MEQFVTETMINMLISQELFDKISLAEYMMKTPEGRNKILFDLETYGNLTFGPEEERVQNNPLFNPETDGNAFPYDYLLKSNPNSVSTAFDYDYLLSNSEPVKWDPIVVYKNYFAGRWKFEEMKGTLKGHPFTIKNLVDALELTVKTRNFEVLIVIYNELQAKHSEIAFDFEYFNAALIQHQIKEEFYKALEDSENKNIKIL